MPMSIRMVQESALGALSKSESYLSKKFRFCMILQRCKQTIGRMNLEAAKRASVSWGSIILGGLVFGFSVQPSSLHASTSLAQLNPNPSIFNEAPFNRVPRRSPPTPSPPDSTSPQVPPNTIMTPVNGQVSIRFINQTGAVIDYQVIDKTEFRTLAGRSELTLQDLAVPTTLTFRRQDKGFLLVTLEANTPSPGTLTMTVQETPDFAADRTSVYIDQTGGVFLN
jgi:hypothetical protein